MSEPEFLGLSQIHALHSKSLKLFGGSEGVRDEGLLEGAVMQPRNDFYYRNADIYEVAAAYAFHIAQAQAFLDGNKRTGILAALTFLEMQGVDTECDWKVIYDAMIAIAEKRMTKAEMADVFRTVFSGGS